MMSQAQLAMFVAFLAPAVVCWVLTPWVVRVAATHGLHDVPRGGGRTNGRPVARLGGIVIFAATAAGVLIAAAIGAFAADPARQRFLVGLFLGGTVVFGIGLYDDIRGARARLKLLAECAAALIVYALGTRVTMVTLGTAPGVQIGMLSLPLTVLWIVGVANAFNLIDGLDGLATGIGLVVLGAVMVAARVLGNAEVFLVALALVGALTGFLRYNVNPARIFLGDSGSLFIGFMLAVLSIHGSLKSATAVLVAIPVFALAVPLLDTTMAVLRRWLRGAPVFGPDAKHIHHRLLTAGLTPRRAAVVLCIVAAVFAVYGLSIAFAPPPMLLRVTIGGGALALLLVLVGVHRLNYLEFAEAVFALSSGVRGVRNVIHDQIHARETALLIPDATSLDQVNAILARQAGWFGFSRMEVDREEQLNRALRGAEVPADRRRIWKMDYPVLRDDTARDDPFTLRICCDLNVLYRPYGAERVARILAPTIERWVTGMNNELRPNVATLGYARQRDIVRPRSRDGDRPVGLPSPMR